MRGRTVPPPRLRERVCGGTESVQRREQPLTSLFPDRIGRNRDVIAATVVRRTPSGGAMSRQMVVRPRDAPLRPGLHPRPAGTGAPIGAGSHRAIPSPRRSGEEAAMMRLPPVIGDAVHPDGTPGLSERDLELLR